MRVLRDVLARFGGLSPERRAALVAVTAWNVTLIVEAQLDIGRRSPEEIRGSRLLWRLACLTNTVGPLVYFRWGRRRDA